MKVAGRCNRATYSIPCASNVGFISSRARSTASVTSIVFAPYWPDMVIKMPGLPMISASPNFGSGASMTFATSLSRTVRP